jgi:hypothetical protein
MLFNKPEKGYCLIVKNCQVELAAACFDKIVPATRYREILKLIHNQKSQHNLCIKSQEFYFKSKNEL